MNREQVLIKEILANGAKQADKIKSQYSAQCEKILNEAEIEENKWLKNEIEKVKAKNSQSLSIQSESQYVEKNKIILQAKNEIIDKVFDRALEKLQSMKPAEYKSFLEKILENANNGDGLIISNRKGEKALITKIKTFEKKNLSIVGVGDFSGGVIIEGNEFDLDYSFESLLREKKSRDLPLISKELF